MKEDFLHYLWKFKKFASADLKTSNGESLTIIDCGQYLQLAGPDFFNARIIIANQKWAGNIELHLRSSDWYLHHHEKDPAYENVILHVVWENDTAVFRKDNSEIPVLVLKNYVPEEILKNYNALIHPKSWIFCERELALIDDFRMENWLERLFFERLEGKSKSIELLLEETNGDWEAVLFRSLAKNFGLNTNGPVFMKMAGSLPFPIIRKESFEAENLEALLFGRVGLLDNENEDVYFSDLKFRYHYLLHKYQLKQDHCGQVQFFQHRPDNFPTIRLSQLANLYFYHKNLFSELIAADLVKDIYTVFEVSASPYWQNHYQFDKESPKKKKMLAKSFIDLIIINTVIPIRFAYAKSRGKATHEALFCMLCDIAAENNAVIQKFTSFGLKPKNAFQSQSLLQLKNEYCSKSKCLACAIGMELLKT